MKHVLLGAGIGLCCPLAFVVLVWLIQFASMVLAPGPDGPNWIGFAVMGLWTLLFASPFLLLGAAVGAAVGAGVGALAHRGREGDSVDEVS